MPIKRYYNKIMNIKKTKKFLFIVLISFVVLNFILFNNVIAQTGGGTTGGDSKGTTGGDSKVKTGGGGGGGTISLPNPLSCENLGCIIKKIISELQKLAIPIVIIMVLIGGFQIMTAGGNEERVKQGKSTIWWAVIGYVIILLANGLVLVIESVLGAKGMK